MMTNNLIPSLLAFKGEVVSASYNDPLLSIYRNNPLIEALPPILSEEEAMEKLAHYPEYDETECQLPSHLRLHLVQNIQQFVEPLPMHLDLEQRCSRMIRSGYRARNPMTSDFRRQFNQKLNSLDLEKIPSNSSRSTATGFTIVGISGVGKTTAVHTILNLYPQVITHSYYQGQNFTLMQIVWLNLECPHDGSIKGLCLNFFQAVDELLGTDYYKNYTRGYRTIDQLIPAMARVASLHCIGVLVIDEIQHLSEAKSGGSRKMLNFFVQLVNTIGIPVVLVGTYKAMPILSGEFRQTRRGSGQGDLVWDRMPEDEVWELFVESLWRYQYIHKPCPLTPNLSHVLYEVSQGITDFAVKAYLLAQVRAITTGKEKITESIIRSVAKDSLRLAEPILSALRTGNINALKSFEDVHPIDITSYIEQAHKDISIRGKIRSFAHVEQSLAESETTNNVPERLSELPESQAEVIPTTSDKITRTRRNKKHQPTGCLIAITESREKQKTAYESLKQAGYIRPVTEYLLKEIVR